jgi:DNA replication protein DnaC
MARTPARPRDRQSHDQTLADPAARGSPALQPGLGRGRQLPRATSARQSTLPAARDRWIADNRNLLIGGKCGLGKSWLACALAQKACREGYSAYYARMPRLFAQLELAHGDGSFARLFRLLTMVDLLILDDLGPDRLTAGQRRDLMEIIEERHDRASTLVASQLPVKAWHDLIGEPTFADAILDRIVHNAYRLELEGQQSMREDAIDGKAQQANGAATASNSKPPKGGRK